MNGLTMRIALGSDHRGYIAKQRLATILAKANHELTDFGVSTDAESADYPEYAIPVAEAVAQGTADKGILICGTGFGMCIAANKVSGVRAVTCRDTIEAEMSRRHNDANVLCMSADFLTPDTIERMVLTWLNTEFEAGRHLRRVEKITRYESSH
jgi:ribose 5-phosphate isomerase B